jgi:hypothetical protein
MDALPAQWIEATLARLRETVANVRPTIAAAPRPLSAVCITFAEGHEEREEPPHQVGTRWATVSSTSADTATEYATFRAALPQPEGGAYVSNDIIDGLKPVRKTERWIPPNARSRRRPL